MLFNLLSQDKRIMHDQWEDYNKVNFMFIKLDHFNYINKNKKGSIVVGNKFGTQENHRFTFTPP